jgi:hypothetical protein
LNAARCFLIQAAMHSFFLDPCAAKF